MTHTEESLMALVNDALNAAEKAEADHCSPMGSPSFRQSNADAREAEAVLRLALREVLAERNTAIANMQIATVERRLERERAEKAEADLNQYREDFRIQNQCIADQHTKIGELNAECERLRKDAERYRWLRDGCDNKGTPASWIAHNLYGKDWDAAIDAAIAQERT